MKKNYVIMFLCAAMSSLSGCISSILEPDADPTVFYLLQEANIETKSDVVLDMNVSPISLPAYMDRFQIVSYGEQNKLKISEYNRWAESLGNSVIRVNCLNLKNSLAPESRVYAYPISAFEKKLPTLSISIFELAGTLNGKTNIKAGWTLRDPLCDKVIASASFEKSIENGKGYVGYVDSLSTLLADLSADIVKEIAKK